MLLTVRVKVSVTETEDPSVAVTIISRLPTFSFNGVPENVRLVASKLNQDGRSDPSLKVAEYVRLSPASTSLKVSLGIEKLKALSSSTLWSEMALANVGASFTSLIVIVKAVEWVKPLVSVAVTVSS